jgi:hypothetical protein
LNFLVCLNQWENWGLPINTKKAAPTSPWMNYINQLCLVKIQDPWRSATEQSLIYQFLKCVYKTTVLKSTVVWTQGFTHLSLALYHLRHTSSPQLMIF